VIWADARDQPYKQLVDVGSLLALQPDVLVIHPAHAEHADRLCTLAAQAGVTVINFQRPVHGGNVDFFIGGDTFEQGRMTAAFVAKLLGRLPHQAFASVTPYGPQVLWDNVSRWVDAGHYATSAGVSAGTDMGFYLVKRLCGRAVAETAALAAEYDWHRDPEDPIRYPEGAEVPSSFDSMG